MGRIHKIDWHSGFAGGLGLCLRKYEDSIDIEREHLLTEQSTKIDFLVVKKRDDVIIDNSFGRLFRKHNIIEYKNPHDSLDIDTIWKCIGYAGLYKGLARNVDAIPQDELTISIFRATKPIKLFSWLKKSGFQVDNPYSGVYIVHGVVVIPLQIIVTIELEDDVCRAIRLMQSDADEYDLRTFITEASRLETPGEREDADAVMQVLVSANQATFEKIREEESMCQALEELMSDRIEMKVEEAIQKGLAKGMAEGREAGRAEGREQSLVASIRNLMKNLDFSAEQAMNSLGIPKNEYKKYMAML